MDFGKTPPWVGAVGLLGYWREAPADTTQLASKPPRSQHRWTAIGLDRNEPQRGPGAIADTISAQVHWCYRCFRYRPAIPTTLLTACYGRFRWRQSRAQPVLASATLV